MRSERFSLDDANDNMDNFNMNGIAEDPEGDESASDEGKLASEIIPIEKLHPNIGETAEAGEEHDGAEGGDHDVDFEQPDDARELPTDGQFVAGWIVANFPDITSEAELRSQVTAFEQTDYDATRKTSTDPIASLSDTEHERCLCEECCAFATAFVCEDCGLALCIRCTDAIHIVRSTWSSRLKWMEGIAVYHL